MQRLIILVFKTLKAIRTKIRQPFDYLICSFIFYTNGVRFSSFKNNGYPKINVGLGGKCYIGKNFKSNNREMSNPIGRFNRCSLIVGKKGSLIIGDNVGMSSTAIVCYNRIEIGNNVNLGGNVVIYDTDFHSINPQDRLYRKKDVENTKTKPVKVGNNVFIGAHSTILKGVTIGDNSVVGACSVVTRSIPNNEIWAGNPAKFIRSI
jgi:acetyltransferase-like isoleucine patch superfamily enzyme